MKRLDAVAARYDVPPAGVAAIESLLALVERDPTAPTSVRSVGEAIDVHVADSLTGLDVAAVSQAGVLGDLGAGAGFPGLVLAAARPTLQVTLIEAASRKCAFLTRAIEAMGIDNAEVTHVRAEAWPEGMGRHDVITARAVDTLSIVCEYAAPLLCQGGVLVAWKGTRDAKEDADATFAAGELGLELVGIRDTKPYPASRDRHLYVYSKVRPTPNRYPRRPGIARKRPLAASSRG